MFARPRTYKPISGKGTKATVPSRDNMQPWEVGYLSTDLQVGEWGYNADDKIWFQRTSSGIKEIPDPDFKNTDGSPVLSKNNISDFKENPSGLEPILPIKIEGIKINLEYDDTLELKDNKLSVKDISQTIYQNVNESLDKLAETFYSSLQKTAQSITLSVNQKICGTDECGSVLKEEYQSAISQSARQIDLSVNRKIWGSDKASERALTEEYKSAITATAEKITLEVDQKINDSETGLTESFNAELSVQAGRISLVVDSTNGVNTVKAGVIVDAINGSNVTIAAERVNIAGAAIFTDINDSFTEIGSQFTSVNQSLTTLNQDVLGKLDTGSAAEDINGHETTIHGGKITTGTITSLGLVESFTGLFVKDDTAPGDHYVYGVTKSSSNGKLYPKMFLGERRTWNYASTTDIASGFIVERDSTDDKYKFHIGDNMSYLNYDGGKLRLGGVTLTEIVDGIPTDVYKIVNGTVVFQLPLASISNVTAYSSLTPPPSSWWDGLSTIVDQSTIGYVNGKLTVLSASSGVSSWNELSNIPFWLNYNALALFEAGHGHDWSKIAGKPSFSTVATTGNYNDLLNKPSIPSLAGYATEAYVNQKNAELVNSAPETLNTLNELATALGNDPNFATTTATLIGQKQDSASSWNTGNFNPNNYSLATHIHSTLYGNLTEVKADDYNSYTDLRFHAPGVSWGRIRQTSFQFHFLHGSENNYIPIYAGDVYSNSYRVWDAGNFNPSTKQNQLNGSGFIKANGASITYDNTSYQPASTAWNTSNLNKISTDFIARYSQAKSFKILDELDDHNEVAWTIELDTVDYYLRFYNAVGTLVAQISQQGDIEANGNITAFAGIA